MTADAGRDAEPRYHDGMGDPHCPHCRGLGYLREETPVGHPHFGRLQPCMCQVENMSSLRAERLRRDSNTETLNGKTFDTFLPEGIHPDPTVRASLRAAFESSRDFAEERYADQQKWLLLSGGYGCGKTHLAAAIANHSLANGRAVLFLNTPDLLDDLRASYAPGADTSYNDRFESMRSAPLLILDDLGTESPTNWAIEKLYQLLNYRYNAHLPTVITTNKELKDIDPRIASRLSDQAIVINKHINAPDFRSGQASLASEISSLGVHSRQTFDTFDLRGDLAGEARQQFLDAVRNARHYAEDPQGWFVLTGPFASGKTHLAAAIANQRSAMGKPVIFVTYQDLSDLFRTSHNRDTDERNQKQIQQVKTAEFVVIDDVSPLVSTAGFFREKFFQVFNYRFDGGLPTVITTSADDKELDPRIKSRIFFSEACQVHLLKAPPYRGKTRRRGKA